MEIQVSNAALEPEESQGAETPTDDGQEQAADANAPDDQDNPNDDPTEQSQSAGEDEGSLTPAQLKALHKMRQKDREDINELKTLMKQKEERDQQLAAQIVGDVIRNPNKLGEYLSEYGLSGNGKQESEDVEVPPDIENMSVQELYKTLAKKAEEVAIKKATAVARSESTYVNSQRDVETGVKQAWQNLMDQDGELRSNTTFQRTVAAMANDLLKEKQAKNEYRVGSETEILKSAYQEVMKLRGKPAPKKAAPVTEEPTPSVNKTVPKRRGNTDADILTRIQRRLSELDSKYKD